MYTPLTIQTNNPRSLHKNVSALYQNLTDRQENVLLPGRKQTTTSEEIDLFIKELHTWNTLDEEWSAFLNEYANKTLESQIVNSEQVVTTLLYLKNVSSGVANAATHIAGQLLHKFNKSGNTVGLV